MSPSWDPAVPQAMQQHGGRNRPLSLNPSVQEIKPADAAAPKGTSIQVFSRDLSRDDAAKDGPPPELAD